jgi:hypothetical protein
VWFDLVNGIINKKGLLISMGDNSQMFQDRQHRENLSVNSQVAILTTYFLMTSHNVPFRQLFPLPLSFTSDPWYTPGGLSVNLARKGLLTPLYSRVNLVYVGETSRCRKPSAAMILSRCLPRA